MSITCPNCGNDADQLMKVDTGKKVALALMHDEVCPDCYSSLPEKVSQGMKLRKEEEAKHQNKIKLWKGRVDLVKQGRSFLRQKAYHEAAISYEKYLKVLELIYERPPNGITPDVFSNSTRSKELTIVVTVYWDLLRIYDVSAKTHNRMDNISKKLTEFAKYSNIYPDIIKKAESFSRTAKNTKPVKDFLKAANANRGNCFIATAAFNSAYAPEVAFLRIYRDYTLVHHPLGLALVKVYYRLSPPLAVMIKKVPALKPPIRAALRLIVRLLQN